MAPPAYTRRLLGGTFNDSTPLVSAPVPAGLEWVIVHITWVALSTPNGFVLISIPGPLYLTSQGMQGRFGSQELDTHQVVEPGETITAASSASGSDWTILITGYVLTLT